MTNQKNSRKSNSRKSNSRKSNSRKSNSRKSNSRKSNSKKKIKKSLKFKVWAEGIYKSDKLDKYVNSKIEDLKIPVRKREEMISKNTKFGNNIIGPVSFYQVRIMKNKKPIKNIYLFGDLHVGFEGKCSNINDDAIIHKYLEKIFLYYKKFYDNQFDFDFFVENIMHKNYYKNYTNNYTYNKVNYFFEKNKNLYQNFTPYFGPGYMNLTINYFGYNNCFINQKNNKICVKKYNSRFHYSDYRQDIERREIRGNTSIIEKSFKQFDIDNKYFNLLDKYHKDLIFKIFDEIIFSK